MMAKKPGTAARNRRDRKLKDLPARGKGAVGGTAVPPEITQQPQFKTQTNLASANNAEQVVAALQTGQSSTLSALLKNMGR